MSKNKKMHYYMLGICGVSMSGIAYLLQKMNNEVSGSDLRKCQIEGNIKVYHGHDKNHIKQNIDRVVYTAAASNKSSQGFVELKKARDLGIKTMKRSELLGQLMNNKFGIAITGMHGKTTVSTMISLILEKAGYDPTCLIGTDVKEWGRNARFGKSKYFVVEACEYERQMLDFRPKVALITNMEEEHLDTYTGGMKDIKHAFKKFVKLLPKEGLLVLCADDPNVAMLKKYAKCKVKFYSVKKPWLGLKLQVPGEHNLQNATGAARLCHELGVNSDIIKKTLNNFTGAGRRTEIIGKKHGVLVMDDYAHHPTEIKKTLRGIKEKYPDKRLVVVYQPHQQQRTKILFDDFVGAFGDADKIIMNKVYLIAGREKETKENLAKKLTDEIKKKGKDIKYIRNYDEISDYLVGNIEKNDILLTMGATDIYKLGKKYLFNKKDVKN